MEAHRQVILEDWKFLEMVDGDLFATKDLTKKVHKLPVNRKDTSVVK